MATASELFLVRFRYWLVCGGMITRSACGTTISRSVWPRRRPSDCAASHWPLLTARMPERTISAMKAAGVDRQAQYQRHELGLHHEPAARGGSGPSAASRSARGWPSDEVGDGISARRPRISRAGVGTGWPVQLARACAPSATTRNGMADQRQQQMIATMPNPWLRDRLGQEQAAGVEQDGIEHDGALARPAAAMDDHRRRPEQELQQQRDVADDLDIDRGRVEHQPVVRQPGDAHR